ncbi:hypothetical protein JKL49_13625 [Phenylobacterium sp. 20VBR1]|uniref:Uncharacterized protein n=1 Tax=Phenylobacterium glaciei TaxID=2803784 RepID=A0A941D415_9CAUL|nr:hypothetical protein [Phenylobacterium glaciei]MBR7620428.1 hypothetical protein [Phenylobacterium glaciei]
MTGWTGRRTPCDMDKYDNPKSAEREAQLAKALRANLRRRKVADRPPRPAKTDEDK